MTSHHTLDSGTQTPTAPLEPLGFGGYTFPMHKLKRRQTQPGKTPLVLVACGSFSRTCLAGVIFWERFPLMRRFANETLSLSLSLCKPSPSSTCACSRWHPTLSGSTPTSRCAPDTYRRYDDTANTFGWDPATRKRGEKKGSDEQAERRSATPTRRWGWRPATTGSTCARGPSSSRLG